MRLGREEKILKKLVNVHSLYHSETVRLDEAKGSTVEFLLE
jgi:hypothetical protein